MPPSPPAAPRRPHALTAHGDTRIDDWYWLRSDDRDDPEVLALLQAENDFVNTALAHTQPLQEALFAEMKARIKETDLSVPFRKDGRWFYSRTEEGKQYPILCRTSIEPAADLPDGAEVPGEEVLLDMNVLAGDSDYFGMGAYDLSPDQHLLLYSTDHDGSERYTMRVRDLRTGVDLPEVIPDTTYGTAWAGDAIFFYVRQDAAMRPHQVWRHEIGTDPSVDVLVYEDLDERFFVSVGLSLTEQWVHISTGSKVTCEEHLIPVEDPRSAPRCVQPREQDVEYDVTHAPSPTDGDRFLILTNADGAVNFKLMSAPVDQPDRGHWTEVVPHRPDVKLEGVTAFAAHLIRYERREGVRRIIVTPYAGGVERELPMAEPVYDTGPATNAEFDTTTLRFTYTSLVTPGTVFDEDLDTGARRLLKQTEVLGGHDPSAYETDRLWATAPDGVRVPISYVHRAGIAHDGSAPCLLYGYGSYEACMDPTFSTLRLSLLDRGFVFAIAHVRGGGELGRPWYDDGKELHKTNTFTDFIACAEHLVSERITAPSNLVARGGSAGGMLMGAIANARPDLFAAVVAEVPFVDCLTTILDDTLPLTVTEWEEWGNPVEDPTVHAYMKAYSPYDNVEARAYPTILATAGLNDPRVSYWEPAKWVQKLRAASTSGKPIYLKTEMGAGHQGPSGRYDAWKDEAFVFAFILDALGLIAPDDDYASAKQAHLDRLDAQTPPVVVVFGAGKTGTTTIASFLKRAALDPVLQVHNLGPTLTARREADFRRLSPDARPRHLWEAEWLAANPPTSERPWRVVATVRDPIAVLVSTWFQEASRFGGLADTSVAAVAHALSERWDRLDIDWFDFQFRQHLGIDVYDHPFDPTRGYGTIMTDAAEVLLLRQESFSDAPAALEAFFGLPPTEHFQPENVGLDKEYAELYQAVREHVRPPLDVVDRVYASRLLRHFYSAAERAAFAAHWTRPSD